MGWFPRNRDRGHVVGALGRHRTGNRTRNPGRGEHEAKSSERPPFQPPPTRCDPPMRTRRTAGGYIRTCRPHCTARSGREISIHRLDRGTGPGCIRRMSSPAIPVRRGLVHAHPPTTRTRRHGEATGVTTGRFRRGWIRTWAGAPSGEAGYGVRSPAQCCSPGLRPSPVGPDSPEGIDPPGSSAPGSGGSPAHSFLFQRSAPDPAGASPAHSRRFHSPEPRPAVSVAWSTGWFARALGHDVHRWVRASLGHVVHRWVRASLGTCRRPMGAREPSAGREGRQNANPRRRSARRLRGAPCPSLSYASMVGSFRVARPRSTMVVPVGCGPAHDGRRIPCIRGAGCDAEPVSRREGRRSRGRPGYVDTSARTSRRLDAAPGSRWPADRSPR